MKSKKRRAIFARKKNLLPLFGLFVLGRAAEAQQQIMQPQMPAVESVSQLAMTNDFQVFAPPRAAAPPAPYEPFSWDQFAARPHADYQLIDASGILAAPGDQENSTIQQISPGILFNLGPHWSLDYTATLAFYSNTRFKTEFDNSVTLAGQTIYKDWIFGFLQSAVLSSSPLVETGGQTDQQIYTTAVTGHHEMSEKISSDLGVYQSIQFVGGGFENARDWSTLDWLNCDVAPKLNFGVGGGLGYVNVDFGPDQTYEQAQGRMNWRATDKISFQASGGVEEREFLGAGDLFSPIYSASIQYQPFAATQISIGAGRSVSQSYFVNEITENTSFYASLGQRFFGQFYLYLNGSYETAKYTATTDEISANRTDDYYSFAARLSHGIFKRGTAAIFYEYSDNKSTADGYTYSSNQIGVEIGYSF